MILFVHGVGFVEVRDLSRKSQFFSQLLLFCVIFIFYFSAISLFYSDHRINMIVAYNISTIAIKMKCVFFFISFKFQWFFFLLFLFSREFIFQAHFKTFLHLQSFLFENEKERENHLQFLLLLDLHRETKTITKQNIAFPFYLKFDSHKTSEKKKLCSCGFVLSAFCLFMLTKVFEVKLTHSVRVELNELYLYLQYTDIRHIQIHTHSRYTYNHHK